MKNIAVIAGVTFFPCTSGHYSTNCKFSQDFGVVMIVTAILIFTNYDKVLQAKLLDVFPAYSMHLYQLETQSGIQKQLDILK